jgi:Na+:H+ antiporter, NhaA family
MILTRLYKEFFNSEKAGGLILVFMTILSLGLANSPWQNTYSNFWDMEFGGHSIVHWINVGLALDIINKWIDKKSSVYSLTKDINSK